MFRRRRSALAEIARRLEDELSATRARTASLEARVEAFEAIVASVGAPLVAARPARVPACLAAAAAGSGSEPIPVAVDTEHGQVLVLVRPGGDPAAWWQAIQAQAARRQARRLRCVS